MLCKHKTSIGGQAVIEGVMMKSTKKISMSVRMSDGTIDNEIWDEKHANRWYTKCFIIRGVVNFFLMMVLGYQCILKSAEKSESEAEENYQPSKFEKKLEEIFGEKLFKILLMISTFIGLGISLLLFMWLPSFLVKLLEKVWIMPNFTKSLIEGVIKISIFIAYISLTSLMNEMKTLYKYHGAEHKTISCYEAEEELTVENVRNYSRFHPRCGTSFLLIVLVISILVFSLVSWNSVLTRVAIKLILMPIVVGISYEFIKITARYDNKFNRMVVAPGLWLQKMTTREPDDSQIEVAISAIKPVIPENKDEDRW